MSGEGEAIRSGEVAQRTGTPNFLKMYEVPGHGEITSRVYQLYLHDKEQWDSSIDMVVKSQKRIRKKLRSIRELPEEERLAIVEEGLRSDNIDLQYLAARQMLSAIKYPEKLAPLYDLIEKNVREGLSSYSPYIKNKAAEMTIFLDVDDTKRELEAVIAQRIRNSLLSGDKDQIVQAVGMINYAPFKERNELLEDCLNSPYASAQAAAAKLIRSEHGFGDENERAVETRLRSIVSSQVQRHLVDSDPEVRLNGARMLQFALKADISQLIRLGLQQEDSTIWPYAAGVAAFQSLDTGELHQLLVTKIENGLQTEDPIILRNVFSMIRFMSEEKERLTALAQRRLPEVLSNALIDSSLYYAVPNMSSDTFQRASHEKDGSATTLLGGSLKEKVIIRHITPEAFVAWQAAYENYALWEKDFGYVPIEPIVSYQFDEKNSLVHVASGVLDISLGEWERLGGEFIDELFEDMKRIENTLLERQIIHGHSHLNNFCLRFYRDEDGKVDLSRKPRIYLIDFDKAEITE